ncbi:MAG: hypothetical protein PHO40_05985 [Candidatus Omnitrophica bacterium]|nr:hypothetical protein [Candidatus Omnitrophota bacterium]
MENKKEKWYFKTWSLAVSFFFIGPFMLPLVWVNPGFSKKKKVIVTLVILVLSCLLTLVLLKSLSYLNTYYQLLQNEIY